MTSKTTLIVWEKWADPFGEDTDETKWRDYNNDMSDLSELKDEYNTSEGQNIIKRTSKPIKVIASPLGLIPYNEHTASSKIFNFWLGHTNFDITQKIKDMLEKSEGVEILDIFTRYRFRVAIGKCFSDSETMKLINDRVYSLLKDG